MRGYKAERTKITCRKEIQELKNKYESRIFLNIPFQKNRYLPNEGDKRPWLPQESTVCFQFISLVRKIKKYIRKKNPEYTYKQINETVAKSLVKFTINDQKFNYTIIPYPLGGYRWYILCPNCNFKAQKLYLPDCSDRERLYLCKWCHKLKPLSQILAKQMEYRSIARPLKDLEEIKNKLLKNRIEKDEAEELLNKYDDIENRLANSVEYKLWKFRREHGKYT